MGYQTCFSPSARPWLGPRPARGARDAGQTGQRGSVVCGAVLRRVWGWTGPRDLGGGRLWLCSAGSVGRTGNLRSTGEREQCWLHITVSPIQGPAGAGGGCTGAVLMLGHETSSAASPKPAALLHSRYRSLGGSQQESAHRRNLLHSSGFRNISNQRIPLFKSHRGESRTQRVNCNESPFGFSSPSRPGARWQPCARVFIAR